MGLYLGNTNLLPTASATEKGGVKIGNGLSVTEEILNAEVTSTTISALPTILSGTSAPTSSQGKNGDIYVQYTA